MKAYTKQLLSKIVFVIFLLLLLFILNLGTNKNLAFTNQEFPTRLIIPRINVNAKIQQLGITPKGEMEVPNSSIYVGWYKLGPRPGEKGSAVIAGHFNGANDEPGVFFNLYQLKKGDKIYVKNDKEKTITFVIRESRIYDPGYANDVFISNDSAYLNLITCDGVWDGTKNSYSKRLVVFADIVR